MLYLVISSPHPGDTAGLSERQRDFWAWIAQLAAAGQVRHGWRRLGRGAAIVFDAPDHEALHELLRQWAQCIPAAFDVQPLLPPLDPAPVPNPPAAL